MAQKGTIEKEKKAKIRTEKQLKNRPEDLDEQRHESRYCTTPTSSACAMHHGGAVLDTVFGPLWAMVNGGSGQGWGEAGCCSTRFEISCDAGILLRVTVSVVAADGQIGERIEISGEDIVCAAAGGEVEEMMILRRPPGYDIVMTMMCSAEDASIRAWIIGPDPDRSDLAIYRRRLLLRDIVVGWGMELAEQISETWVGGRSNKGSKLLVCQVQ